MKNIYVYPGCFTPPTYGHHRIVERAAKIFPQVIIICSTNEEKSKTRWFSEEECKEMWSHYKLPKNVVVETFSSFMKKEIDYSKIIMIRGIRDESDLANEQRVMELNKKTFGIDKYFYILAEENFAEISASNVRKSAEELDLEALSKSVAPMIVTKLLEKVLSVKNVFMVVGRTGAGKSTFLKKLSDLNENNVFIETDSFNKVTKSLIYEKYGKVENLTALAINNDADITALIATKWLALLKEELLRVPKNSNVFIEIPYGLKENKRLFRYVGGKILYIDCQNSAENIRRVIDRGTPHHVSFIEHIPDSEESKKIAKENNLSISIINNSHDLEKMIGIAKNFSKSINEIT